MTGCATPGPTDAECRWEDGYVETCMKVKLFNGEWEDFCGICVRYDEYRRVRRGYVKEWIERRGGKHQ